MILSDFLMFNQIFLSLQVKQRTIIRNKPGVCELLDELMNDVRLRICGNKKKSGKSQNLLDL